MKRIILSLLSVFLVLSCFPHQSSSSPWNMAQQSGGLPMNQGFIPGPMLGPGAGLPLMNGGGMGLGIAQINQPFGSVQVENGGRSGFMPGIANGIQPVNGLNGFMGVNGIDAGSDSIVGKTAGVSIMVALLFASLF